ncbi:MAG: EAL domain-containing protein [Hyphomicrobiaceae bacterium]|nr:EAL domain-containing protein [Hyphomicrobiaceae bacterium]
MNQTNSASRLEYRWMLSWKLPLLALGVALIASIWGAIWLQIVTERRAMLQSLTQESTNLSLVFEQNTERTASEIDRIIRYLRATYERNGYTADWPVLVQEEFTANRRTVQIAIMDVKGMMITSTKMLHPEKPVDLSDREHFRVHANAGEFVDRLFISQPVLGRASNKWSVQFTRPYHDRDGAFAGVIVVSLDPEFLTRNFASIKIGDDGGLAIVGEDGIVRAGAGSFHKDFGKPISDEAIVGNSDAMTASSFVKLIETPDGPRVTALRKLKDFPLMAVIARSDAPLYATWESNRKKYIYGGGSLTFLIIGALMTSIIRRRAYERQLNHLARHDALTDLLNRREFEDCLTKQLGQDDRQFNVHLIDLDGFKRVNDTYGHPVGDELLVVVGQRLRQNLRIGDMVARLGGDEFAIIQEAGDNGDNGMVLAERICHILAVPYTIDGKRIEIGASVGIVQSTSEFENEDHLMRSADLALYACKNAGGRTYRLYNERMNDEARERREIEAGLRDAIALGQLEVHYQPIYTIKTLEMNAVEALIRWRHPEKGMISPGAFIPVAEQSGLIVQIGAWVMERACMEISARSPTLAVAVNVSAVEFRDGDVSSSVRKAIAASGIDPKRLKVEITESLLMKKDRATLDQLDHMRNLGIRISMDDFGTGYSSLSYLQSYPIDCIKIDQSFVRGLGQKENSTAIIEAISRLAQAMGVTAVAEGVETEEQLALLAEIGCSDAQGFLLSRPKPIDELDLPQPAASGELKAAADKMRRDRPVSAVA